jgi:hypothetical protein
MEWIDVKDRLPSTNDIVRVKRENGDKVKCYFHKDAMSWLMFYGVKTSYFQERHGKRNFLFDVTHWMPLKDASDGMD